MTSTERSDTGGHLLSPCAGIVESYVAHNSTEVGALAQLIHSVYEALASAGADEAKSGPTERPKPAVPISRSVQDDYIVCLEDGKRLKMLKRYLRAQYDMGPEDYRRRWGLAADYPMVAPAYARRRSEFAKSLGLGRGVRRGSSPGG